MDLAAAFDSLAALEARCGPALDAFLAELTRTLRGPLPADTPLDRDLLRRIETTLDAHRDVLRREPARLLPCLYDELAGFGGAWLARVRAEFEARSGAPWLRPLRPPRAPFAALPAWRFDGDARSLSADGKHVLARRGATLLLIDATIPTVRATFADAYGTFTRAGDHLVVRTPAEVQRWSTAAALVQTWPIAATRVVTLPGASVVVETAGALRELSTGTTLPLLYPATALRAAGDTVFWHDGKVWCAWQPASGQLRGPFAGDHDLWTALSPAGDRLIAFAGGRLRGWTLADQQQRFDLQADTSTLAFHPSGQQFATRDGVIRDADTGRLVARLPLRGASTIAFDPTGKLLLACRDHDVELWDLAEARPVARVRSGSHGDRRIHWSADGRALVVGDRDTARVADLSALAPAPASPDDARKIRSPWRTRFAPDATALLVDHDGGLGVWTVDERPEIRRFVPLDDILAVVADGARVLGRRGDELVAIASATGDETWTTTVPGRWSETVVQSDGVVLHSRDHTGPVIALGAADGRERYRLDAALILADRDVFVTRTGADLTLHTLATGAAIVTLIGAAGNAQYALSADHRWLAVLADSLAIWDLKAARRAHTLDAPSSASIWFRDDHLVVSHSQSPQSGNQDWNTEAVIDATTGATIASDGWYDQERPTPSALPGVPLPYEAVIGRTADGAVFAARAASDGVELWRLVTRP